MLLFLGAIIVPCLVLVALGVRMIVQEEQLRVQRAEEERQRRVDRVGQELLSRLERLKLDPDVTSSMSPPETVVLVGRVRDGRLILPWDVNPDTKSFRDWIESSPFAGLMQRAAHEEHVAGKPDAAVRFYREALASTSRPAAQVYARLSLARALIEMDKREEGFTEYGRILETPPDMVDENGIPLALYAAPPLLDAGIRQKETLALVRECIDRSYKAGLLLSH